MYFCFGSDNEKNEAITSFGLDNMFGQLLDEINLEKSTLDQLNWMSQILGELREYF